LAQENNGGEVVKDWQAPPLPGRTPLRGRYVALDPLNADRHAADLYQANCAPDTHGLWAFLPYGPFSSVSQYHHWARDMAASDDPLFFAVVPAKTGRPAGVLSLMRIMPDFGSIEVGHINFAPELQRSPAATEAIFLVMKWAFEAGYRRFEWKCDAANLRSRRAAERFGFSYEGVFRQHLVSKGRNRDTAWFAAIDKEWPALKEAYESWLSPSNFNADGQQIESLADLTRLVRVTDDPVVKKGARG